jgi:crotonobetainyl-CoA:carnitine CoA-transferase CaiB-like acyl-CoA transferase
MLVGVPSPNGEGNIVVTGIPIRMSGTPLRIERSFPALGEHNEEIYCGLLGYSRKEMDKLKEKKTI